jgi:STE24 endopeptidase
MASPATVTVPVRSGPRRHYGAWRAASAVPAMVGSLLMLAGLFAWMGSWEPLLLLGWIAVGLVTATRRGERVTVALNCGFRRPNAGQARVLLRVWTAALARTGLHLADVELYVQRSRRLNAYSAGRRSVAVTTGVLSQFRAGRLNSRQLEAVLVHELGHHATRATRWLPLAVWLAAPWRFAARVMIGIGLATVGRRHPRPLLALGAAAAAVTAVVQSLQQGQTGTALLLASMLGCAIGCPMADAGLSRRSEYAADRFAADCGAGPQLVAALWALDRGRSKPWAQRALSRHPSTHRRIQAIYRYSGRS